MTVNSVTNNLHVQTTNKTTARTESEIGTIQMVNQDPRNKATASKPSAVEQTFNKDIESGKLKQNVIEFEVCGFKVSKKLDSYSYTPSKGETYGDIKYRYRLPNGTLRNEALGDGYSGNLDNCKPKGNVNISGDAIRAAIEASKQR